MNAHKPRSRLDASLPGAFGPGLEGLEPRLLLTGVAFGPQSLIVPEDLTMGVVSVAAVDLDGDGDLDALSVSQDDGKIAWYANTDGAGAFGPQRIIDENEDSYCSAAQAADLDGDGDLDVVAAFDADGTIAWFENLSGLGTFGPRQAVATDLWAVNSVQAADLDGDGDLDVLAGLEFDEAIAWYENFDGAGASWDPHFVSLNVEGILCCLAAADLDGDGDLDVLAASGWQDNVAWYENLDGAGSFGPAHTITTDVIAPWSVAAADLDGDGDLDVLSASFWDDKIAWYENLDGAGGFGPQQVIAADAISAQCVAAADMDADGDLDVLAACGWLPDLTWYENTDGAGAFGPRWTVALEAECPECVAAADLDGDGDADVLTASGSDDRIAWYENLGFQPVTLTTPDAPTQHDRAGRYWVEWSGNGEALALWSCGPTGWQPIAEGLPVWPGDHGWDTAAAPLGWYCLAAQVTPSPGQPTYETFSPACLRLADAASQRAWALAAESPSLTPAVSPDAVAAIPTPTAAAPTAAAAAQQRQHPALWPDDDDPWPLVAGLDRPEPVLDLAATLA